MTYNIKVRIEDAKVEEFLKIIESFKTLGLIKDYDDSEVENEIIGSRSDEELIDMVQTSRQQIADGKGLTTEEAKVKSKTWRKQ